MPRHSRRASFFKSLTMNRLIKSLYFCAIIAGTCFATACSDDNDAPQTELSKPVEIAAAGETSFTLYSTDGTVRIPLTVSNATEELEAEQFTLTADSAPDGFAAKVESLEAEGEIYVVTASYSLTGANSATANLTLGYAGTEAAVPVTITCYDAFRAASSFVSNGCIGSITLSRNPEVELPETIDAAISAVTFSGTHAAELQTLKTEGMETLFEVSDTFSLSEEETATGYAEVPVALTLKSGDCEYTVPGTVRVCAARVVAPETVTADETRHIWMLPDELISLGMDKTGDMVSLIGRKAEYYFARKGEPLKPIKESGFEVTGAAGERHHWVDETQEEFIYPAIYLMKADRLPAGEYIFVAHLKKLKDNTDDNRWVDIVMPVSK